MLSYMLSLQEQMILFLSSLMSTFGFVVFTFRLTTCNAFIELFGFKSQTHSHSYAFISLYLIQTCSYKFSICIQLVQVVLR